MGIEPTSETIYHHVNYQPRRLPGTVHRTDFLGALVVRRGFRYSYGIAPAKDQQREPSSAMCHSRSAPRNTLWSLIRVRNFESRLLC